MEPIRLQVTGLNNEPGQRPLLVFTDEDSGQVTAARYTSELHLALGDIVTIEKAQPPVKG